MLDPSIQVKDHMSRGCHPSGAVVRIAAMSPEKPARATEICVIAMSISALGIDLPKPPDV
jgi:hypothetical protein